ncbi:MAG: DUF937 domain-containing protein [Hyphomonadaceae bacterium]|jgi:hypothetical protein|nr:DUF937 domain-containing protein [Hyphomonadaceae bacterium]
MTDSIIAAVSRFLTPEIIGKMASATGLDATTAQKAADASVPAILGGLADLVAKPGGARQLAGAIAEQPVGLLSTLTSAIGSNAQLQERGGSVLASLLGSGALGTLISSVSKFAGIGEGSARSLMGMLAPIVLGVLGREQRTAGLETGGLARMLTDQKDQFAAAVPAGLSSLLGTKGAREGIGAAPSDARVFDGPQAAYPRPTSAQVQQAANEASGYRASWAYWALPLLAIAGLLWYLLPSADAPNPTAETKTAETKTASVPARAVPRADDKSLYLTKRFEGWTSISTYHNQEIYNRAGERIGVVKDLLIGPDGKINAAVIGVGRFLGIGDKDIAVPLAVLLVERRDNSGHLIMDVAKDLLRTAPAFEQNGTSTR